jgi:hypothetical protein
MIWSYVSEAVARAIGPVLAAPDSSSRSGTPPNSPARL